MTAKCYVICIASYFFSTFTKIFNEVSEKRLDLELRAERLYTI